MYLFSLIKKTHFANSVQLAYVINGDFCRRPCLRTLHGQMRIFLHLYSPVSDTNHHKSQLHFSFFFSPRNSFTLKIIHLQGELLD